MDGDYEKSKRKRHFIIAVAVFIAVVIICLLLLARCTTVFDSFKNGGDGSDTANPIPETTVSSESETEDPLANLPENPIDINAQRQINDDIYSWIYIPDTNVNYPILQSSEDDLYYLRRGVDKNYLLAGVLFTQSHNRRDFSDPVTVIYGHNMTEDGSMFATLHNFEDPEFFENHKEFNIYTNRHILTYEVVSAFKYDNRHIMNSFDFDNEETLTEFFATVTAPNTIPCNVREGITLTKDDKIVILSTCMADNTYRYLVCGVLRNDELTK